MHSRSSTELKSNGVLGEANETITIKKILVTPEMAKEFLEKNILSNRRVREAVLLRYSNDMKEGRWKDNTSETIKITSSNIIIDGQHRLKAVVKSGVSINFHIAFNIPDKVFDVLDTGCSRSASDIFRTSGIKNDNILPSIIQQYFSLTTGWKDISSSPKNARLTNAQILEHYLLNEKYWQEVARKTMVWYNAFAKICAPSVLGGFYAYFETLNEDKAYDFIEQLCTGFNIEHDAIVQLRNKLMKDKMSIRKMTGNLKFGLIIKAWNYFRQPNRVFKLLKFDPEKESFPLAN